MNPAFCVPTSFHNSRFQLIFFDPEMATWTPSQKKNKRWVFFLLFINDISNVLLFLLWAWWSLPHGSWSEQDDCFGDNVAAQGATQAPTQSGRVLGVSTLEGEGVERPQAPRKIERREDDKVDKRWFLLSHFSVAKRQVQIIVSLIILAL